MIEDSPLFQAITEGKTLEYTNRMLQELKAVHLYVIEHNRQDGFKLGARDVNAGIIWEFTPQGHEFWSHVYYEGKFLE